MSEIGRIGRSLDALETEAPHLQSQTRKIVGIFALVGDDRYVQEFHAALVAALANRASNGPAPASLDETANKMPEITRRNPEEAGEGR
jgi:hypothetical protein